jgi:Putative Flp pilus-assembly TadE/G-like
MLAFAAMIGLLAMVIDAGLFYMVDSELQNAADAAALAAVWYLPACQNNQNCAPASDDQRVPVTQLVGANLGLASALCAGPPPLSDSPTGASYVANVGNVSASVTNSSLVFPPTQSVTVTAHCNSIFPLGGFVGRSSLSLNASATAAIGLSYVPPGSSQPSGDIDLSGWPPASDPTLPLAARLVQ